MPQICISVKAARPRRRQIQPRLSQTAALPPHQPPAPRTTVSASVSMAQRTPSRANSSVTWPCRASAAMRSITRWPKPLVWAARPVHRHFPPRTCGTAARAAGPSISTRYAPCPLAQQRRRASPRWSTARAAPCRDFAPPPGSAAGRGRPADPRAVRVAVVTQLRLHGSRHVLAQSYCLIFSKNHRLKLYGDEQKLVFCTHSWYSMDKF